MGRVKLIGKSDFTDHGVLVGENNLRQKELKQTQHHACTWWILTLRPLPVLKYRMMNPMRSVKYCDPVD